MQSVATAAVAVVDSVVVDDDVGVIRPQDRRVITPGGTGSHDVTARHRRQVVHQRGQVVAGFEQHEPARPAEFLCGVGDGFGEFVVRERCVSVSTATRSPWRRRWSRIRLT